VAGGAVAVALGVVQSVALAPAGITFCVRTVVHVQKNGICGGVSHLRLIPDASYLAVAVKANLGRIKTVTRVVGQEHWPK
jgi:hypothetical protein